MSFDGEVRALEILEDITTGLDFNVPIVDVDDPEFDLPVYADSDLYRQVRKLTNEDLTTRIVGGTGTFDALMATAKAHLDAEHKANRITGAEYTKAYIATTEAAMGAGVQFLLGRDASFWQAQMAQMQAITARIQLQTAKMQLASAQMEALTNKANYALTVMKLATEDATFGAAKFQVEQLLPQQKILLQEQTEAQRAQTMNTRSDGVTPVAGSIGKQSELYSQQIVSYQRDSETKAAKMFLDSWVTQKTIDEGILVPSAFSVAEVNEVFQTIKVNNDLG